MSTTTATFGIEATATDAVDPRKGLLQRLLDLRHRHAEARAMAAFERLPDAMLADLGFEPDQSRHTGTAGSASANYWA